MDSDPSAAAGGASAAAGPPPYGAGGPDVVAGGGLPGGPEPVDREDDVQRGDDEGGEPFTLRELLTDPIAVCRAMSAHREGMPARPLNVDLTPTVARRFDDECRALRVKKKDVVEVLLRSWLAHRGQRDLDELTQPDHQRTR